MENTKNLISSKMSTKLPGYEDTVICPYNKSHIILRERIQFHLVRCRRSHPNIKLETCPFDLVHRMRKEDLEVSFTSKHK